MSFKPDPIPIIGFRTIRPIKGRRLEDQYACVRIVDGSMTAAGILEGDIAIVRLTKEARAGDLVLAITPMGMTVRFLEYADGRVLLRCADSERFNQKWDPKDVTIQGVVKRVERDYEIPPGSEHRQPEVN